MELNARRTAPLQKKKKKKLDVAAFGSQSWGRGGRESVGRTDAFHYEPFGSVSFLNNVQVVLAFAKYQKRTF